MNEIERFVKSRNKAVISYWKSGNFYDLLTHMKIYNDDIYEDFVHSSPTVKLMTICKLTLNITTPEVVKYHSQAQALKVIQDAWNNIKPEIQQTILHNLALEKWDGKLPDTVVGSEFIEKLLGALGGQR